MRKKMRALISVYNKQGIVKFAKELEELGIKIISSGGTAEALEKAGISVTEVSKVTGFPEMLDGRVKTLHPRIHAGILAKRDTDEHMETLKKHCIETIDIVVVNLYPFEETIEKTDNLEEIIEKIDIGGPSLVRAAAKNYQDVLIITDPNQYQEIAGLLKSGEEISMEKKERLAIEAFAHTAQYDAIISNYLRQRWTEESFPKNFTMTFRKIQDFRYGENPHQKAAFYEKIPATKEPCIITAEKAKTGKEFSHNNALDADAAIECLKEFQRPTCVIIKHATPCGIASADNPLQAWKDAYATDTYSPFGGVVAFNRELIKEVAEELSKLFLEVIIAPKFSQESLMIFETKKGLRLLEIKGLEKPVERKGATFRSVTNGLIIQDRDLKLNKEDEWKIVTEVEPTKEDLSSMEFAVKCVKHIKSNSVVFVKGEHTVGIGGGQTARVDATSIAVNKGKENIKGSIMASDAFFPFRDAVDKAAEAGVKAIAQPGGSIRDEEAIKAANEHKIAMVFTGQRYFRH